MYSNVNTAPSQNIHKYLGLQKHKKVFFFIIIEEITIKPYEVDIKRVKIQIFIKKLISCVLNTEIYYSII